MTGVVKQISRWIMFENKKKFNLWMYPDTLEKVDIIYFEKSFLLTREQSACLVDLGVVHYGPP